MSNLLNRIFINSLIFIVLVCIFLLTISFEYNHTLDKEKEDLSNYLETLESDIDKLFTQRIINLKGFIPYIQLNPNINQNEFEEFASRLLSKEDLALKNISLTTDSTITHIYPMENLESLIGVDLSTIEEQKEKVLLVKEKRETVVDGPFELYEGGSGIICRIPVVLDPEADSSRYVGQLNYVMDFDEFLKQTGLEDALDNYNIRITQLVGVDKSEKIIVSNTDVFSKDTVSSTLQLPNVEWEIIIENKEGFDGKSIIFYSLCFLGVFLVALAVYSTNTILISRQELKSSLEELKETQNKLVLTEKLAALGSITAGVAHEINTPLGNTITSVSYLEQKDKVAMGKFKDGSLTRSDLESYFESNMESHHVIVRSLNKMVILIEKFKLLTAEKDTSRLIQIELKPFLEELLASLKYNWHTDISVKLIADDITIFSDPVAITNIFSNLVQNSIDHSFKEQDVKEINITVHKDAMKNSITAKYWDNGAEIHPEIRDKIFSPFFSTKRNEGHAGLGLHIVFNAVVNKMNGSISLIKDENDNDVFLITIPTTSK